MPYRPHQIFLRRQICVLRLVSFGVSWKEHWFRSQSDLALAPGGFLTGCVTLRSFGVLSLGFLICKVGMMILTSQGRCGEAAKAPGRRVCVCGLIIQSRPTLCDATNYSPPGSSVHGILQARIWEWVVMPSSRGSSQLRDWTQVSCIAGGYFTIWANRAWG